MRRTVIALMLGVACTPALAKNPGSDTAWAAKADDRIVLGSDSFLGAHPDLKYRLSGMKWYAKGDWTRALEDFRHAARFGDKPSQGMVGEMYWTGQGVEIDRALAYVWMDLAAERAYPVLLARRELYWNAMSADDRARALEVGVPVYEEYGDAAAKPRLERKMRLEKRSMTGSRVGSVGALTIYIPTVDGTQTVDGTAFWDDRYWEPEQYWDWQDYHWKRPPRGEVTVGDVLTDAPRDDAAEDAAEEAAEDAAED